MIASGGKSVRWLLAGAVLVAVAGAAVSYTPGWLLSLRPPTEREMLMYYFAQNIGETALCDQISWAAHQSYSDLFGGGASSYWRSDCYERVTQARKDASICGLVRPAVDLDPWSAGYSASSCRRRTRAGYRSGIALADEVLLRTFDRLGYDLGQMRLPGEMSPAARPRDVYRTLEHEATSLGRAQELLRQHASALEADDASFLARLAAIGGADPNWCHYIAAGRTMQATKVPFRDWCYFTVAVNTRDPRICTRMTPAGEESKVRAAKAAGVRPQIAEQMGLQFECLRSRDRQGPSPHYGPQVPDDGQQLRRLIAALGVATPSAQEQLHADAAVFYQQYVLALWPKDQHDPARDAARAELVRRLLRLPAG